MHVRTRALAEVRSLRIPSSDEPVAVLHGAFLPRCRGARVVDPAADDRPDFVGIQKLTPVVGRDREDLAERLARDHPPERCDDIVLRDVFEQFDDVSAAFPVDHDE